MQKRDFIYDGPDGNQRRAALYFPPDNRPNAFAILTHDLTDAAAENITRRLNENSVAVLGQSQSTPEAPVDVATAVQEIMSLSKKLSEAYSAPSLLIGHGGTGFAAIQAATELPAVKAVATIGVRMGDEAVGSEVVKQLKRPLLVLHSPVDEEVVVEHTRRIFEVARHPKSFLSLDTADHHLSRADDSRFAGDVLASWVRKYLLIHPERTVYADVQDNRVSARTAPGGYRTDIIANGYALIADEPESLGGTDTGPTPYDFLAAALASCTSMTLHMYASRKEWKLGPVTTRVKHSRIHVTDCDDCGEKGKKLDHLEREIEIEGDLDEAQRKRLIEIANRCPVHRTLESDIRISTHEADPVDIAEQINEV